MSVFEAVPDRCPQARAGLPLLASGGRPVLPARLAPWAVDGAAWRWPSLSTSLPALLLVAVPLSLAGQAASASVVYRCPGVPVLYTDALSPQDARDRGCTTIEGAPVTIVQTRRPQPPAQAGQAATAPQGSPTPGGGPGAARSAEARVDPAAQRARDTDARRILGTELQREQVRLAELQREYNNGEPERRGDERNYQRYLDRVADLRQNIARQEANIAALQRELARLPQ
jgi:hypothetical protein